MPSSSSTSPPGAPDDAARREGETPPAFDRVYDDHADFVFRSLARLGVPDRSLDDAVQEVFLVVHRRLGEFRGDRHVKTWLFRICMRVASHARRGDRRTHEPLDEDVVADRAGGPAADAERRERVALLHRLLGELDEDKRTVFVLATLEQMTMPEIAETLEVNLNTAYTRLRTARRTFDAALARHLSDKEQG